jgi:cellulose synthase/poly-beta-1,6-N-acetylglucosamine synthase-like glycosyltransferase
MNTSVSVVVPLSSDLSGLREWVSDLVICLKGNTFEIIMVSTEESGNLKKALGALIDKYSIKCVTSTATHDLSAEIQDGIRVATGQYIFISEEDCTRYVPKIFAGMLNSVRRHNADIVIAKQAVPRNGFKRVIRVMFGTAPAVTTTLDTQKLKLVRRELLSDADSSSENASLGSKLFASKKGSEYKVAYYSIRLRTSQSADVKEVEEPATQPEPPTVEQVSSSSDIVLLSGNEVGATYEPKEEGFYFKGKRYVTYNTLDNKHSAIRRLTGFQIFMLIAIAIGSVVGFIADWHLMLILLTSGLTTLYFCDLLFNLLLVTQGFSNDAITSPSADDLKKVKSWPKYTVLCPLYKESIILPQFIDSMRKLDYPKAKLQVLILLEEDDVETQEVAKTMKLPGYFEVVVVPNSTPKTKPKACNYGLTKATGEYIVIYDAEDVPDPMQLKKAVYAFQQATEPVGCVQAKLNYYNWDQNLLTRLFTLEYSLWFDLILTGLQKIHAPIPLGGTSNHFKLAHLHEFGGWDPFNVTEDADLGMRLSKRGFVTLILDSTTLEEANSDYGNWIRQRSRWIKGYIQTFFVHNRKINRLNSKRDYIIFQLVVGGKVISALVNPLFWLITIAYFVFRTEAGPLIKSLYIQPVYYMGIITLIVGNFLYMYYYMLGAARRGQYKLILFGLVVPFYWLMMSVASYKALKEYITKPFHWQKTKHGLHLVNNQTAITDAAKN